MISTIGQRGQRAAGTPRMAVMIRLYRLVDSQQDATNGHPLSLAGKTAAAIAAVAVGNENCASLGNRLRRS